MKLRTGERVEATTRRMDHLEGMSVEGEVAELLCPDDGGGLCDVPEVELGRAGECVAIITTAQGQRVCWPGDGGDDVCSVGG